MARTIVVRPSKQKTVFVNQADALNASRNLSGLDDVDLTNLTDGALLIYDATEEKFLASTILEKQIFNGGHF